MNKKIIGSLLLIISVLMLFLFFDMIHSAPITFYVAIENKDGKYSGSRDNKSNYEIVVHSFDYGDVTAYCNEDFFMVSKIGDIVVCHSYIGKYSGITWKSGIGF
jgi:hypothetical protein